MNDDSLERLADRVRAVAAAFPYPAPRLASRKGYFPPPRRRVSYPRAIAWAALALLALVFTTVAVPQARAGLVRLIQIGAVRLQFSEPSPVDTAPTLTPVPRSRGLLPPLAGPSAAPPSSSMLDGLAGETTLEDAQLRAAFEILVPAHPADLGPPDRVFVQDLAGTTVLLAWSSSDPGGVRLLLYELSAESWGLKKLDLQRIQAAEVDGEPAIWATGPYLLLYANGEVVEQRIVGGHALIWESDEVTFRLESDLELVDAIRIAESLE